MKNKFITELNFPNNPLINSKKVFLNLQKSQFSVLDDSVITDKLKKIFETKKLKINKIVAWQWNLNALTEFPHTDGYFDNELKRRNNGINFVLNTGSVLDFWDLPKKELAIINTNETVHLTYWNINYFPVFTWDSLKPSIVNPQFPHRVKKIGNENIRRSIVISFNNNLSSDNLSEILHEYTL